MKRAFVLKIIVIVLVTGMSSINPAFAAVDRGAPYTPPAGSREELYQDIFVTL